MKLIILAAGQGTRLRPLTNDIPKCMVKYNDKAIIDYILDVSSFIEKRIIISGYKANVLENYLKEKNITFYNNNNYNNTNMVSTLFCAKKEFDDDIIISYADIVYKKEILEKLSNSPTGINVVIDRKWRKLWEQRMDNPLDDAETLKVSNGKIIEIGKKANSYNEIEGQYIGLIKISKDHIGKVLSYYNSLSKTELYDEKNFDNMYMTSFLQKIIDEVCDITPIYIDGGWIEIDSINDLESNFVENGLCAE